MKIRNTLLLVIPAIPFLVGCNKDDNSQQTINEVNSVIESQKDSINTCYDALSLKINGVSTIGDKLSSQSLSKGREFVYDSKAKQFIVMRDDEVVKSSSNYTKNENTLDLFKFVTTYNPNSKYSQYLLKDAPAVESLLITTGFDAGSHRDIQNLAYTNLGEAKEVIIRSYNDTLSILAPNDTIHHYDSSTNVLLTCAKEFIANGEYAYFKATEGTVNIPSKGNIDLFEIVAGYDDYVTLKADNDAKLYGLVNCTKEDRCPGTVTAYDLVYTPINTYEGLKEEAEKEDKKSKFIRLDSDIVVDKETLEFKQAVCIDLNGYRLTFNHPDSVGASGLYEGMRIQSDGDTDKSVYIIDSQGKIDDYSGIYLNDCSIVLHSNKTTSGKTSNLFINSGKITQTIKEADNGGPAISVIGGVTGSEKTATLTIYGGKLVSDNQLATKHLYQSGCIGVFGNGANVKVDYGALSSNSYCIYNESVQGYTTSNPTVNINGGKLTSTKNACIHLPLTSTLNINGGTIKGASCINMNSGILNIDDAKLYATGQHLIYSEKNYDGSVIYIPRLTEDEGRLDITVTDSILQSQFAYILSVTGKENSFNTDVTFNSGNFTYYLGNGIYSSKEYTGLNILNKSGTWTKREQ